MTWMATRPAWMRPRFLIVGCVVLLLLAEQLAFFRSGSSSSPPATPSRAVQATGGLRAQVSSLLAQALGKSDRGVRRFHIDALATDPGHPDHSILHLTWAVNGSLAMGSVSAGAQVEVYLMLSTLYTHHLPLSDVWLTGTFGDHDRAGRPIEVTVLKLELGAHTAALLDWGSLDATTVWPLIHRIYIRPGFVCNCQE